MQNFIKNTTIALFVSILSAPVAFTQSLQLDQSSKTYSYSEVITFDGQKENELFSKTKEWALSNSANFNRRNGEKSDILVNKKNTEVLDAGFNNTNPLKLESKEDGKLILNVATKYNGTSFGTIRTMYVNYDLKIFVKDGKLKFEASNFNYKHINNATGKATPISGFKDGGDCGSSGTFETLSECKASSKAFDKALEWFQEDITELKETLIKKVQSNKNERDF